MNEKIIKIKELMKVQGQDGNWNHDPYMHGLYNGMELSMAIMEDREPAYRTLPISEEAEEAPIKEIEAKEAMDKLEVENSKRQADRIIKSASENQRCCCDPTSRGDAE